MKNIIKLILGSSLLIASASAFSFNMSSRDFGMGDNDDSWDNDGPWKMSSGSWNTGPFGGGPFNTDTRNWGFTPWNQGNRNNTWGGRNSPWGGNTPWNWNRDNRAYGNPYYYAPYGDWYGNPYQGGYSNPYNTGQGYYPYVPASPPVQETQ